MAEYISELRILGSDNNIFDTEKEYLIPLYQRAYAWEDKQITQLVEDISDISDANNYYIGSLVVSENAKTYEVVDGQQRLTSLFLLLNCLGLEVQNTLSFACRDKSNYTLRNIKDLLQDDRSKLDMDRIESGIQRGIDILMEELNKDGFDKESFIEKLKKVIVYRIVVPDNTDLNRYFEIMNTRGEQLEQYDILKATLMSYLPVEEHMIFARIWDACSDMTGYVQMHFVSKNNVIRERLFGYGWNGLPSAGWDDYKRVFNGTDLTGDGYKIEDIIDIDFKVEDDDGYLDDDVRVRFESVIEFPYFLIHTLKVLIDIKNIMHEDGASPIIAELMDDKKLIDSFSRVISYGSVDGRRIGEDSSSRAQFSRDFIICLLRTRFLFDKYIVKREYANENSDGDWSLKCLEVSNKRPYYKNTRFSSKGEWNQEQRNPPRVKENIMLQSALRVSYTSPKVMHWITGLLKWLSTNECMNLERMADFRGVTEDIAKKAVIENFFNVCKDGSYAMGVSTPHIVFNYLDFLLWDQDRKKYDDFVFEFRNSVEHWYPQHPSEGTFEQWKDGVDQFGNLCIIQRNVNSKFSNMAPEAKKSTFTAMIDKGSLKLRIMRDLTEKHGDKSASMYWRETAYKEHEKEMIALLAKACGTNSTVVFAEEEDEQPEHVPVKTSHTSLNVASIMLDWAKGKERAGEIELNYERCGKRFVRYTTKQTSELLPEAEEAASGWGTKTHYYYEIVNNQERSMWMQLALSADNIPDDLRATCERICEKFPSRVMKENWRWRTPYVTPRIRFNENTTKEEIINALEICYEKMADFERRMLEAMK